MAPAGEDTDPTGDGNPSDPVAARAPRPSPAALVDPQPLASLPPSGSLRSLVQRAQSLFDETYFCPSEPICTVAPGRVNLIGEHTDYTEGYVLPMCIGYSTVCFGKGKIEDLPSASEASDGAGGNDDVGKCTVVSTHSGSVVKFFATRDGQTGKADMTPLEQKERKWANYVMGVVAQYLQDLPRGKTLTFELAVAGDVPLGSGLSSSASLEVAVATFLERLMDRELPGSAYSSSERVQEVAADAGDDDEGQAAIVAAKQIERALRCQTAEHEYCNSPCGIMDQFISSAGLEGCSLLIDCRSKTFECATLGLGDDVPAIVVANSGVTHSIGDGEYEKRVVQCREATEALQNHRWTITKLIVGDIKALRDATPSHVEAAKEAMSEVAYKRARHVTTENKRTTDAKAALVQGNWGLMGKLMNESHDSLRDDYKVSCEEVDKLVELARECEGVYGSRMTGGGFGGCTVTLVKKDQAESLMDHLRNKYKKAFDIDCVCFETSPCRGAREIAV